MFRFCTLGRIELTAADGHSIHSVLSQPKRVSLLAYLVVAPPRSFHRRDSLLGIFWPESDEDRARNSLRQSIHFLKRSFQDQLLVSRGDDELGVDAEQIWCDVLEFERLLAAGRNEEALALYQGEFLAGMFVSQAPEFERWLERERGRLSAAATTAAWNLVEQRIALGDLAGAVGYARRAMELSPMDEAGLRRLLTLYDQLGDRAGAVQLHAEFARRVEIELGIEPSAETQALIERIRTRDEVIPEVAAPQLTGVAVGTSAGYNAPLVSGAAPSSSPAPVTAVAPPAPPIDAAAPPPATPDAPPAEPPAAERGRIRIHLARPSVPRGPGMRRGLTAAGLLALLLVAMVGTWSAARSPATPVSTAEPRIGIVVLPFAVHGSAGSAFLSEGMVDVLTNNLEGAGAFAAIDQNRVLRHVEEAGIAGPIDPADGVGIARSLGADYFVTGTVLEIGDRVQVAAMLYQLVPENAVLRKQFRPVLVAQGVAEARRDDLLQVGDLLSTKLLVGYHDGAPGHLAQVAALTAGSYASLKAFLKGETALRAGNMAAALEAFQGATALDSVFALAHYRVAVVADWIGQPALAQQAAETALRHANRLAEHDRWLVEAYMSRRRGEILEADQYYRAVLASHPDELEAWWMRGELLMRFGPLRGHPMVNAKEPFERAVFLDPTHRPALLSLAMISASQGLHPQADSLFANWPTNDDALPFALLHAFVSPDSGISQELEQQLRRSSDFLLFRTVSTAAVLSADIPNSLQAARLLTLPTRSASAQRQGYAALAALQMARGNWSGAQIELSRLDQLDPLWARQMRAQFALLPFVRITPPELVAARAALGEPVPAAGVRPIGAGPVELADPTVQPQVRDYLLGLLSAQIGDRGLAAEIAARLERTAEGGAPLQADWAHSILAQLAHGDSRPEEALRQLDFVRTAPAELALTSPFHTMGYARYLRAEILFQSRRYAEALDVYRALEAGSVFDMMFLAPSYLRQGQILEYLGQPEAATRAYRRVVQLLHAPDPRFASLAAAARRRLIALERQGPG